MSYEAIKPESRADWLEARRRGIGSSEAAILILGRDFGHTPTTLWEQKVIGILDDDDSEHLRIGLELEPSVRAMWMAETHRYCDPIASPWIARSTEWPFMQATVDSLERRTATSNVVLGPVEFKTTGNVGRWDEGVPRRNWIQVQHQLAVTGFDRGSIAVLGGGFTMAFRWADIERDDEFINDELVPACREFWECVRMDILPPADAHKETSKALARIYPDSRGGDSVQFAEAAAIDAWERHKEISEQIKVLEQEKRGIENWAKAKMGEAEHAVIGGGRGFSWKTSVRNEKPRPARTTTVRTFRRKEAKS